MTKKEGYEVALDMYKREHDRWVQNALVLLGALVSIFALREKLLSPSLIAWGLGIGISATAVLVITSIRLTTDAWRDTLEDFERLREDAECLPFQAFGENLKRYSCGWDLTETLLVTKRNVAKHHAGNEQESRRLWVPKSVFSVTRSYTRLALLALFAFTYKFLEIGLPRFLVFARACLCPCLHL